MNTRFTETYGIEHPIVGAAMAFATLSARLPVAVCEAGALGGFAAGPLPLPFVRETLDEIRAQTSAPFHLNLITPFAEDAHIELALEIRPAVVSFHWELPPASWVDRLHDAGLHVWQQIGTPHDACRAVALGVDAVVAQGSEAGGHCYGRLPLFALLPAVLDAVGDQAIVVAAGGIVDGRGLAGVLAIGADAGMIGTRLLATPEADIAAEYKQRIVAAGPDDTLLSSMFGRDRPDFNPMRLIRTPLVEAWHRRIDEIDAAGEEQPVVGSMALAGQSLEMRRFSSLLPVAGASGDFDQMPLTAGQGLGLINDIRPAGDVIETLANDAARALAKLASP